VTKLLQCLREELVRRDYNGASHCYDSWRDRGPQPPLINRMSPGTSLSRSISTAGVLQKTWLRSIRSGASADAADGGAVEDALSLGASDECRCWLAINAVLISDP
jgi:hypothetical protein